jgi:hypothetical protein
MASDNKDIVPPENGGSKARETIAMIVLLSSIGGLLLLALAVILLPFLANNKDPAVSTAAREAFNSLLPVFGTWVGTLLAFYFAKDNFEAATRSVTNMAGKLGAADQKLQQIQVKDKMRMLKDIDFQTVKRGDESGCVLNRLLEDAKYDRILMLDEQNRVVYLVYKATITQFISQLALGKVKDIGKGPKDVTLQDMFNANPTLKTIAVKSFGFVPQTGSLADAQREMERTSKESACNDIFVTATGRPDEALLGWVTDNTISENLKT